MSNEISPNNGVSSDVSSIRVTIILPNWNGARWLPGCLRGLAEQTFRDFDVMLVDNCSADDSIRLAKEYYPSIHILPLSANYGFSVACNRGVMESRSAYVAFLNTDTAPQPHWLERLVSALDQSPPSVGAVTSNMLDMDQPTLIENAGVNLHWDGLDQKVGSGKLATSHQHRIEVFAASAGAGLYRRRFLEELGGFNEEFVMYLEDVDLALRGRILGYTFILEPGATVLHRGHGSGLPSARYVRFIVRNRLLMLAGALPGALIRRHGLRMLYGQWYFFLAQRRPLAAALGYWDALFRLSQARRECQDLWRRARLTPGELDRLLPADSGLPTLRRVFAKRMGWLRA
jgi:GT2 family glycosyltransferase